MSACFVQHFVINIYLIVSVCECIGYRDGDMLANVSEVVADITSPVSEPYYVFLCCSSFSHHDSAARDYGT